MSAILVACAVLLMQGGTAFAALYQGDIGETRFSTVEGTYILKRYVPPQGGASGAYGASSSSGSWSGGGNLTVVPPTPQQGEYEIVDEAQSGWDVTFDFDHSRTFTIYNEAGPTQRIQYRPGGASVYVTNLVDKDSIFDGEYERQASGDFIAYIPGVGERKLPRRTSWLGCGLSSITVWRDWSRGSHTPTPRRCRTLGRCGTSPCAKRSRGR